MKKAARLSSSLLAKKGFASPAAAVPMFGKAHYYGQMHHHHIRDVVYDHVDPDQVDLDPNLPADGDLTANPDSTADAEMPVNGIEQESSEDAEEPASYDEGSDNSLVKRIEKGLKSLRRPENEAEDGAGKAGAAKAKSNDRAQNLPEGCCKGQPSGKRVAMTLRLDHPRHLRLRVLSAHTNRSSQDILTEALDNFLDQFAHMAEMRQCDCLRAESGDS